MKFMWKKKLGKDLMRDCEKVTVTSETIEYA
jgi:hypothetical protein